METADYAKRGQTSWRVTVALDDGTEPLARTVVQREYMGADRKELAKAFAERQLAGLRNPPATPHVGLPFYWASLERGTYQDASFDEPEDGWVLDATWEPGKDEHDEPVCVYAHLTDDRQVLWEEESS